MTVTEEPGPPCCCLLRECSLLVVLTSLSRPFPPGASGRSSGYTAASSLLSIWETQAQTFQPLWPRKTRSRGLDGCWVSQCLVSINITVFETKEARNHLVADEPILKVNCFPWLWRKIWLEKKKKKALSGSRKEWLPVKEREWHILFNPIFSSALHGTFLKR